MCQTAPRRVESAKLVLFVLLLLIFWAPVIWAPIALGADPADEPAPDPAIHADASDDASSVGPVTVTATRGERGILEIAGNVSVIDREKIEQSGVNNLPDLLRREPGLFVTSTTSNPAGVQVEARGFNNGGSLGSSLLVQIDGRRVNEADTGNTDWALIQLDDIESIEIVRGPASAIYGDNAVAGVINIRTRVAEGPPRATLRGHVGRFDSGGGSFRGAGTFGPITAKVFAQGLTTDSYRRHADYDDQHFNGSLQTNLGENFILGTRGGWHKDHREFPGDLSQAELDDSGRRFSSPGNSGDKSEVVNRFVEAWFEGHITETLQVKLRPYYRWRDDDVKISFGSVLATIDTDKKSAGTDLQFQLDEELFGLRNRLIFGSDFLYEETDRGIESLFGILNSDNDRWVVGVFLQEELNITPELLLTAGVRYDHADLDIEIVDPLAPDRASAKPSFDVWSPRASLTWLFRPDSSVYASYGRGFRFPNFDEDAPLLSFPPGGAPSLPDLKTQKSDSVEVGIKHFGERVEASMAAYIMWVENEITFAPFPPDFPNANFDKVRHIGVETALAVQLLPWLRGTASYTFEHVEIREDLVIKGQRIPVKGEQMPITPRHRGTIGVFAGLPHDLEFGATANIVGSRPFSNDFDRQLSKLDLYTTLDLHFGWRPQLSEHVSAGFTVAVRNVTGEKYADFGTRNPFLAPAKFRYPATRRVWELAFVLHWKSQ